MSLVLVVEPDASQAQALRTVLQKRVAAELVVVASTRAAVLAIDTHVPDLILVSALLSPRDEDALMAHLRSLETTWLQTLTIPQLRCEPKPAGRRSAFGFGKKRPAPAAAGCDPAVFAEEIVAHLARAAEARSRNAPAAFRPTAIEPQVAESSVGRDLDPKRGSRDAWDPFSPAIKAAPDWHPVTRVAEAAVDIVEPVAEAVAVVEPPVETVEPAVAAEALGDEDEIERLARQLGLHVQLVDATEGEVREADLTIVAELERVRADAEQHRLAELARLQAEADAAREAAIAEARAAAELEAREALTAELSLVRSDAERALAEALDKVKMEAEQSERLHLEAQEAFAAEIARVRADVEQTLGAQLHSARVEAERVRTAEAEVARVRAETERVRAEAEARLHSELERIRQDAQRSRLADLSDAKEATEQIRARAEAEIARVRAEADAVLETELRKARAEAEARQHAELKVLRSQMGELREVAAQQARAAAAEAVASEVARATSHSREVVAAEPQVVRLRAAAVIQFPRELESAPIQITAFSDNPPADTAQVAANAAGDRSGGDYYSLWQATSEPVVAQPEASGDAQTSEPRRRRTKWALPIAASLVLVTNTGSAISTFSRFVGTGDVPVVVDASAARKTEAAVVVEQTVGHVKVESTPPGAAVQIDGRQYGQTPTTVSDLAPGAHTVVLRSDAGTVTRRITINVGETAVVSEEIFAGWIAIFSPIPLDVALNGKPLSAAENGRIMIAAGTHEVELISGRFNYRGTERLEVHPGAVTAHTVSLPSGTLHVAAPEGAEISVDGAVVGRMPMDAFPLPIGAHEVTATLPDLGERRTSVDVRFGEVAEAALVFEPAQSQSPIPNP